jgi:PAS domain S-box-containing protein
VSFASDNGGDARTLEALRESEERYKFLAESIPVQIWTALPDGRLDYVTEQTARYLGLSSAQLLDEGWQNIVHPDDLPSVVEKWKHSLATGDLYEVEFRLKLADGKYARHLGRAIAQRGAGGKIVRWFGTNTNIDVQARLFEERKHLLQEAERASRAKDEFLATASHELRTPLNAILGWTHLLRSGQLDANGNRRALETVERNARAQVQLIEDILDGSRLITGKLHLQIRALDMTALVRAALDAVTPAAQAKQISVTVSLDRDAARIVGDPERLQQVVWNLANNAIKFTPKHGTVDLRLVRAGTHIQLTVADSGEGISPEFLPHVFERFRQAEGSTSRRHGGLGLGLALVRHLVEAHGGTVRAESEGEGKGAAFIVSLPVQAVFAEEIAHSPMRPLRRASLPPVPTSLRGVEVLVVDDEADTRELVATALQTQGADVRTAASAEEGLKRLSERVPTVIVSDIGMPETDGYSLIRKVRALERRRGIETPALALTAYAGPEDRQNALDAGFHTHVGKPVEPAELARVVASLARYARQPSIVERRATLESADTFVQFGKVFEEEGLHPSLRFLNEQTPYRFTALYAIEGSVLRNVALVDADEPETTRGESVPLTESYLAVDEPTIRVLQAADARRDDRLRAGRIHGDVVSYCGAPIRDEEGKAVGLLCHFDRVPRVVSPCQVPLLEAAASILVSAI